MTGMIVIPFMLSSIVLTMVMRLVINHMLVLMA
jgi:hypothetical protein